jgi:DNA ligase 1
MVSSQSPKDEWSDDLLRSIQEKKSTEAITLLKKILYGGQMALPGFTLLERKDNKNQRRRVKKVLSQVVRDMGLPYSSFLSAYSRNPDLIGLVIALTSAAPIQELDNISPQLFQPIQPASAHRFNSPQEAWKKSGGGNWWVEPKMDGWYCQIHGSYNKIVLYQRGGGELKFAPDVGSEVAILANGHNFILEGELVGINRVGGFVPRMQMRDPGNVTNLYCFDLLYFDEDWTRKPYQERYTKLGKIMSDLSSPLVNVIEYKEANSEDKFSSFFRYWNDLAGMEGMIAKRPETIYEAGAETMNFLKIKTKDTIDAAVLGYRESPRSYLLGLFDFEEEEFVPFLWITPQQDVLAHQVDRFLDPLLPPLTISGRTTTKRVQPDLVVEVEGDRIYINDQFECGKKETGHGWSLFAANLVQIRFDKSSSDVTSVRNFLELPKMMGLKTVE